MENLWSLFSTIRRRAVGLSGSLRKKSFAATWALLFLWIFLLAPTHPLRGRDGHWLELVDRVEGEEVGGKLGIYAILKSHRGDLDEESAWAITETILEESAKYSLDPVLILAVITVESRFQHSAVSSKGARGLMQIRPLTAHALAEEIDLDGWNGAKSLEDPLINIKIGVRYLSQLKKRFKDLKIALAAYNWGPTAIQQRVDTRMPIPQGYSKKVLSIYDDYRKNKEMTVGKSLQKTSSKKSSRPNSPLRSAT